MSTTGHEHELVEVQGLKASMKKGGNIGIYNDVVCSTAGATAAKVTNTVPPSFSLTNKAKILVKFTYGINVANATLQVGENAAKPIFYQGSALDAGRVKAGMFVLMQYDGTNFNILGDIAKMDEYYKDLHAGLADNLFGETQTNDKFIFRPTAGIQDIESGEPPVGGGAIRKVEGNAVAWNQLIENGDFSNDSNGWSFYQTSSASVSNNILTFVSNGGGGQAYKNSTDVKQIVGHKYYLTVCMNCVNTFNIYANNQQIFSSTGNSGFTKYSFVFTLNNASNIAFRAPAVGIVCSIKNVMFIDLTLLFGSGNEPSTAEAFESWLSQNIGLKSYYPYNAGELIPVKDYKVKSVGFNQWDEQWENGYLDENSNPQPEPTGIRSKNYCKCLPSQDYHISRAAVAIHWYDSGKNFISYSYTSGVYDYKSPSNAAFFKFSSYGYGNTAYQDDICFNLSYDDDKDGTYEEYEEHQVNIDVTKVYGKLNGSGDYVQVFPDGVKKAGSYSDVLDLKNGIATKKVKSVDLGTLTWRVVGTSSSNKRMATDGVSDFIRPKNTVTPFDAICDSYPTIGSVGTYTSVFGVSGEYNYNTIEVFDPNHQTAPTSQDPWLNGVILWYATTNPETYTNLIYRNNGVDVPISEIKYAVDDYGTEEVLLGNDEEIVSCAPTMTIKYGINAADTIADLPHDYVSCKPQSLVDSEQRTARNNIAAASQHDMDVVKKQLELIDKKVENDYWVDMGLPSGVIWAKRNVFTGTGNDMGFAPSEFNSDADYFSWGNIEGHRPNDTTFDYNFNTTTYAGTNGAKLTGDISLSQDAAHVNCGEPWRIPTQKEAQELFDNCDFINSSGNVIPATTADKRVSVEGGYGIYLRSKINGRKLFIPCCGHGSGTDKLQSGMGYYHTATSISDDAAKSLCIFQSYTGVSNNSKYYGFTIRPVM